MRRFEHEVRCEALCTNIPLRACPCSHAAWAAEFPSTCDRTAAAKVPCVLHLMRLPSHSLASICLRKFRVDVKAASRFRVCC